MEDNKSQIRARFSEGTLPVRVGGARQLSSARNRFDFKPESALPRPVGTNSRSEFSKYRTTQQHARTDGSGMRWAKARFGSVTGRYLLLSDIPNNRIMRYDEASALLSLSPPIQLLQRFGARPQGPAAGCASI